MKRVLDREQLQNTKVVTGDQKKRRYLEQGVDFPDAGCGVLFPEELCGLGSIFNLLAAGVSELGTVVCRLPETEKSVTLRMTRSGAVKKKYREVEGRHTISLAKKHREVVQYSCGQFNMQNCSVFNVPCSSLLAAARRVLEVAALSIEGVPGRLPVFELPAEPRPPPRLGGVRFF